MSPRAIGIRREIDVLITISREKQVLIFDVTRGLMACADVMPDTRFFSADAHSCIYPVPEKCDFRHMHDDISTRPVIRKKSVDRGRDLMKL